MTRMMMVVVVEVDRGNTAVGMFLVRDRRSH